MHMNLETDFSSINHQYFLKVRGFVQKVPKLASVFITPIMVNLYYPNASLL